MASKSINPFFDSDEIDDETFLNSGKSASTTRDHQANGNDWGNDDNVWNIQSQITRHEHSMLESTQRTLGVLYQTEDIGNETANELLRQGEQLRRTEQKVDKINADLNTSKRYVTSLKGVFSGMRNYFRPAPKDPSWEPQEECAPSKLRRAVETSDTTSETRCSSDHPALRLHDPEADQQQYGHQSTTICNAVDENIDELGLGISRLKDLAIGLGDEMDQQAVVIGRLDNKIDNVNVKIDKTNTDMKKILRS